MQNKTDKILSDFEVQADHLISARRPNLVIVNKKKKKTCQIVDFAIPADSRIKMIENKERNEYLYFAREMKKYGTWKGWYGDWETWK